MTPEDFNELDFEQQDLALHQKGTEILSIAEEWHDVKIYALEGFYVKYRMPKDHDADDIHALVTEEELAPYRELVHVFSVKN